MGRGVQRILELKGLMELIITSYREHGRLDHGLLVQQAPGETQRQHICALTLEEDESDGPAGDFLAADWRRDLTDPTPEEGPDQLKEEMKTSATSGAMTLVSLAGQRQEIRSADGTPQMQVHSKRREWMNKGMGMDGFQGYHADGG